MLPENTKQEWNLTMCLGHCLWEKDFPNRKTSFLPHLIKKLPLDAGQTEKTKTVHPEY